MIIDRAQVAAALPAYELGAQLGAGGFGLVLAARHRGLNRAVAVKIVPAGRREAAGATTEAELLARLDHPHIIRVHDSAEADGLVLIVMELLGGGTLTRRAAGMSPEAACAAGLAVAAALSCAHAHGVLHRDIKPDNMLFDTAGLLKVNDFGIAKIVEGSAATASMVAGTPLYMAPEQILGGRLGPSTDIYALGVVLYQLLAGTPPFDPALGMHALWQHHVGTIPAPPTGVPEPVAQVVLHALAKDPAARQPSAHAFAVDLAIAAARAYGPGWAARSGLVLHLDGDVREAADSTPTPLLPASTPRAFPLPPAVGTAADPPSPDADTADAPLSGRDGREGRDGRDGGQKKDETEDEGDEDGEVDGPAGAAGGGVPGSPAGSGSQQPSRRDADGRGDDRGGRGDDRGGRGDDRGGRGDDRGGRGDDRGDRGDRGAGPAMPGSARPGGHRAARRRAALVRRSPPGRASGPRAQGRPVLAVAVAVAVVLAGVGGTIFALTPWRDSADQQDAAERARLRAIADGLVTRADELRDTAPQDSLRFGLAAHHIAPGPPTQASLLDTLANSPLLATLTGITGQVRSVAFSPDGTTVATGTGHDNGSVVLWDLADRQAPRPIGDPLPIDAGFVNSVAFSPDGTTLAAGTGHSPDSSFHTCSNDRDAGSVVLWDLADRQAPRPIGDPLPIDAGFVNSVAFSPDGTTLAAGTGHSWVEFSRDYGTSICSAGPGGGSVALWDLADRQAPQPIGDPLRTETGDGFSVAFSVAFSPDGATLAAGTSQPQADGSGEGAVVLWDLADRRNPRQAGEPLRIDAGFVFSVAYSRDGATLAAGTGQRLPDGSREGAVALWDVTDRQAPGQLGDPFPIDGGFVFSVLFSPNGTTLAIGTSQTQAGDTSEGAVLLWDLADRRNPRQAGGPLHIDTGSVISMAYSPDGSALAAGTGQRQPDGSEESSVVLWDLAGRQAPRQLGDSFYTTPEDVLSVAFSPDNTTVVVGTGEFSQPGSTEQYLK